MATTKKSSTDALGEILNKLEAMDERISSMENRPSVASGLQITPQESDPYSGITSPEMRLTNASTLLKEGDVIKLKEDSEKSQTLMANIDKLSPDVRKRINERGILGIVKDHKMTSRSGDPKFRVNLPGIGVDGVYLSEMEVVERV